MSRNTGRRKRTRVPAVAVVALLAALSTLVGMAPASSTEKGTGLGGTVTFNDGSAASGVKVDLFEARNPWSRGLWLDSATTADDGSFGFDVDRGCYITVAIAPLGAEFEHVGSGDMYDQNYGCVDEYPNLGFNSVLYRDDPEPPPPPPPAGPVPPEPEYCLINYDLDINDQIWVWLPDNWEDLGITGYNVYNEAGEYVKSREIDIASKGLWGGGHEMITYHIWEHAVPMEESTIRGFISFVNSNGEGKLKKCAGNYTSPIGLDVDGSGAVERISGEFSFDLDANGEAETLGEWFAPTEGILVNTSIAGEFTGEHLFGDQGGIYADGYEKLALLDTNADGAVSGAELDGLAVWVDANSNARVDAGELTTLAAHTVVGLSTSHTNYVSTATLADGSLMATEDLWFPVITGGVVQTNPTQVGILFLMGSGLVAAAFVAAHRRRDGLDAELAALVDEGVTS